MSTFTTNIGLEKPANGSDIGTWDVPINADWDIVDTAIGGSTSINVTAVSGTVNLTSAQYRCRTLTFTGTLTANVTYQLPSGVGGFWFCFNNTSGAFTLTLKSAGGGTTQALAQGYTTSTVCDGTNVGRTDTNPATGTVTSLATGSTGLLANGVNTAVSGAVVLTGTVGIANGGTGATTAAAAINALLPSQGGNNGYFLTTNGTTASWGVISGTGTVTSVAASGGTTGLTFTGSPITTSGTLTVGGTLAVANGGTGSGTAAGARSNLGCGTIATLNEATSAQYQADTSGLALSTDKVWGAATEVTLTDAATITVDMSTFINAAVTLGGNRTLGTPSNAKGGQAGYIAIVQDGTGSRTLAYAANWKFAGGTPPTLSTAAGAVDMLYYQVRNSTFIYAALVKGIA